MNVNVGYFIVATVKCSNGKFKLWKAVSDTYYGGMRPKPEVHMKLAWSTNLIVPSIT